MNSPLFIKRRAVPHCQLMSMDRKTFKRLMGPIVDILQREARLIHAAVYVGSSHPSLFSERHPGWCFFDFLQTRNRILTRHIRQYQTLSDLWGRLETFKYI